LLRSTSISNGNARIQIPNNRIARDNDDEAKNESADDQHEIIVPQHIGKADQSQENGSIQFAPESLPGWFSLQDNQIVHEIILKKRYNESANKTDIFRYSITFGRICQAVFSVSGQRLPADPFS